MNSTEKYSILTQVKVNHEFYGNSLVPIELYLEDTHIKKKYGLSLKRNQNSWLLHGSSSNVSALKEEFKALKLKLKPTESSFYFVSQELDNSSSKFSIISDSLDKIIEIPLIEENITVVITSKSKHFEYILFPKKIGEENSLEIIDLSKMIEFETPHKILWENNKSAFRCVSKEKIKLTKNTDYQLNVIEKSKYGNRIVLNNIMIPKPQSASIHDPYHSITAFYAI